MADRVDCILFAMHTVQSDLTADEIASSTTHSTISVDFLSVLGQSFSITHGAISVDFLSALGQSLFDHAQRSHMRIHSRAPKGPPHHKGREGFLSPIATAGRGPSPPITAAGREACHLSLSPITEAGLGGCPPITKAGGTVVYSSSEE